MFSIILSEYISVDKYEYLHNYNNLHFLIRSTKTYKGIPKGRILYISTWNTNIICYEVCAIYNIPPPFSPHWSIADFKTVSFGGNFPVVKKYFKLYFPWWSKFSIIYVQIFFLKKLNNYNYYTVWKNWTVSSTCSFVNYLIKCLFISFSNYFL